MKKQHESKSKTQVFLPKGTVNPNEDTVIEIPNNLVGKPMVIAKRQPNQRHLRADDTERRLDYSHSTYQTNTQPNFSQAGSRMNIEQSLAETEEMERQTLLAQLEQYHRTRRQYLLDATTMATGNVSVLNPGPPQSSNVSSRSFRCGGNTGPQTTQFPAGLGVSLMVPPLPQIQPGVEEDCCEHILPVGSSTFRNQKDRSQTRGSSTDSRNTRTNDNKKISNCCNPELEEVRQKKNKDNIYEKNLNELASSVCVQTEEDDDDDDRILESAKPLQELEISVFDENLRSSRSAPDTVKFSPQWVSEKKAAHLKSATPSVESCSPCGISPKTTNPDIKENDPNLIMSNEELDRMKTFFEKTKKNLQEVYDLASDLASESCISRKTKLMNKSPTKDESEKRLKQSQEMFELETKRLKKILQDLKISTCNNIMLTHGTESENKPIRNKEKIYVVMPGSSQKSILKQASSSTRSVKEQNNVNNSQNLKKSLSISSKTNLAEKVEGNSDDDSKSKITLATSLYLGDDHTPYCSNVTSTYYNKDFLANSQSEKEVNVSKYGKKDVAVCTPAICPSKSRK